MRVCVGVKLTGRLASTEEFWAFSTFWAFWAAQLETESVDLYLYVFLYLNLSTNSSPSRNQVFGSDCGSGSLTGYAYSTKSIFFAPFYLFFFLCEPCVFSTQIVFIFVFPYFFDFFFFFAYIYNSLQINNQKSQFA